MVTLMCFHPIEIYTQYHKQSKMFLLWGHFKLVYIIINRCMGIPNFVSKYHLCSVSFVSNSILVARYDYLLYSRI